MDAKKLGMNMLGIILLTSSKWLNWIESCCFCLLDKKTEVFHDILFKIKTLGSMSSFIAQTSPLPKS